MANDNSPPYHCAGKEAFFQVSFYEDSLHPSSGVATGTGRRGLKDSCQRRPMYPDLELRVSGTAVHSMLGAPSTRLPGGRSNVRRGHIGTVPCDTCRDFSNYRIGAVGVHPRFGVGTVWRGISASGGWRCMPSWGETQCRRQTWLHGGVRPLGRVRGQAQGRHPRASDGIGGTRSGWTLSIRHLLRISTPGR